MESPVQTITYHDDIGHGAPESQLQSALEVSCDGYALFDSDERLVHANDGYRNLMDGVGELLLPGIPLSTLINESVRRGTVAEAVGNERLWLIDRDLSSVGFPITSVFFHTRSRRWLRSHIDASAAGEPFHLLTDVTAKKEAEKAVIESEQRHRAFAVTAPSYFWETNEDDRFTYLSAEFEAVTGLDRHQVLGKLRQEVNQDLVVGLDGSPANVLQSTNPHVGWRDVELELRSPGRPNKVLLTSGQPLFDHRGQLRGVRGMTRDVTQLRTLEAEKDELWMQLKQTQRFEAIAQITNGVAHDFGNLLSTIAGFTELLLRRSRGQQQPELGRALAHIEKAADRGIDLVQNLLTYSRGIDEGVEPVNAGPLVADAVEFGRSTLPASVRVETDVDLALPSVSISKVHVEQIVMNLMINARDAMDGKGALRVSLKAIELADEHCTSCRAPLHGDYIALAVQDSGSGVLSEEQMTRMFEPFFTTKPTSKGSGIGLAVVHGIAHELGGHVLTQSPSDGGLIVKVLIPVRS